MLSKNTEAKRLLTGHSEINSHVVVGNSLIHGNGLFTDANLEAGTVLFNILAERTRYENNIEMAKLNPNWIGAGYEEWLMVNPGDVGSYLNHSCSSNLILNEALKLIAIRSIKAHEELVLDYSTTELDPYWKMNCTCKEKNCRKIILGFQYLPNALQDKYK